MGRKTTGPL